MTILRILAIGVCIAAFPALAAEPRLAVPIDCTVGRDCWVVNHVDLDPSAAASDYQCGSATYDGHKGVDVGLRDVPAMRHGVAVLAAAAGTVAATRDGVADRVYSSAFAAEVKDKECGNAVRLDHGDGWQTLYCHLRQGSVVVRPGQVIASGQRLGLAGMSGLAQFPHVHFQVMQGGGIVDPFLGRLAAAERCGARQQPLWTPAAQAALSYRGVDITNLGFAEKSPDPASVLAGDAANAVPTRAARSIVFWVEISGARQGDILRLRLTAPDGTVLADQSTVQGKTAARVYAGIGRDKMSGLWPAGAYRGDIDVVREGPRPVTRQASGILQLKP